MKVMLDADKKTTTYAVNGNTIITAERLPGGYTLEGVYLLTPGENGRWPIYTEGTKLTDSFTHRWGEKQIYGGTGYEFTMPAAPTKLVAVVAKDGIVAPTIRTDHLTSGIYLPGVAENTPYTFAFEAAGSPAVWSIIEGSELPPGLTLSADGVLSGTPAQAGTYIFTVMAQNGAGTHTAKVRLVVAPPTYRLSVSADPAHGGTVSGGGTYDRDRRVTVNATALPGYHFVAWQENGQTVTTVAKLTLKITGHRTLTAVFAPDAPTTYDLSATAGEHGTISPAAESVPAGGSAVFTIRPDTGYVLDTLTLDGTDVTDKVVNGQYTLSDVQAAHRIHATFKQDEQSPTINYYEVTASVAPVGGGTLTPARESVPQGGSVVFTILPAEGYQLASLTLDGVDVMDAVANNQYTLTEVTAPHALVAAFAPVPTATTYAVDVAVEGGGGTVSGGGSYVAGTDVTVTATPHEGYTFVEWREDGRPVSTKASYTFTLTGERSLVAVFAATDDGEQGDTPPDTPDRPDTPDTPDTPDQPDEPEDDTPSRPVGPSRPGGVSSGGATVQSPRTFDAGAAVYGAMALLSACGAAYVAKRK